MTKWHQILALSLTGLLLVKTAGAAPQNAPVWGLATSLAGLPAEVSNYLVDKLALADQGSVFNASCLLDPDVPSRRLVIGAISAKETIVAIEHGGRAYGIDTWAFRLQQGHWKPAEQGQVPNGVTLMTAKILVDQHRKSTAAVQTLAQE